MTKPFDPTKPVQTRAGKKSEIVAVLKEPLFTGETIIAVSSDGVVDTYFADGRFHDGDVDSPLDLINIPERAEVEAWALVSGSGVIMSLWTTKEYAKNAVALHDGTRIVHLTGSYER